MIQELIYVNPITNLEETLKINIKFDTKEEWLSESIKGDKAINDYFNCLDCVHYTGKSPSIMPGWFGYDHYLSLLMFHLLRLKNDYIYNSLVDKLINTHCANLVFAYGYYQPAPPKNKKGSTKQKRKHIKNEYVRYTSKDLFTNEEIYTYVNHYTGDEFNSDNPNLLNELNAPKPKKVKSKNKVVSFDSITFNFNIKK